MKRTGFAAEDLPHWPLCTEPGDVVAWDVRLLHSSSAAEAERAAADDDALVG